MITGDRRNGPRRTTRGLFANKYINGTPHVVELLDVSSRGLSLRTILEPDSAAEAYPLELALDGRVVWAWTRRVWRKGNREALRIMAADDLDVARLQKFLRHAIA